MTSSKDEVEDFYSKMLEEENSKVNLWKSQQKKSNRAMKKRKKPVHAKPVKQQAPKVQIPEFKTPQELLQSLQRDINCIGDKKAEKFVRLASINKLKTIVETYESDKDLMSFLYSHMIQMLVFAFSDEVETIREIAIQTVQRFVKVLGSESEKCLQYVIPTIHGRMKPSDPKTEKFTEPSEEVRLKFISLLRQLIACCGKKMVDYLDELHGILEMAYIDFHEVKKESSLCTMELSQAIPTKVHLIASPLAKKIKRNLIHQRSDVRIWTIKALGTLVKHRATDVLEDIDLTLRRLAIDHTPSVRQTLLEIVKDWTLNLDDRYSFQKQFTYLLLIALTDELDTIRVDAHQHLEELGKIYEEENEKDVKEIKEYGHKEIIPIDNSDILPHPFKQRPRLGTRMLIRDHVSKFVPIALDELSNWDILLRQKAAQVLQRVVIYCEEYITQHVENILYHLFRVSRDEKESNVRAELHYLAQLIGRFVDPDSYISTVKSNTKPEYSASPDLITHVMLILEQIVKGARAETLKPSLSLMSGELSKPHLVYSEHTQLQNALLRVVDAIIDRTGKEIVDDALGFFLLILKVISQPHSKFVDQGKILLEKLAKTIGLSNIEQLFEKHLKNALSIVLTDVAQWSKTSPNLYTFDMMVRMSGKVAADHLETIFPVIKKFMDPNGDADLTLRFMNELHQLLIELGPTGKLSGYYDAILENYIKQNLIWRVGKTKAEIRKVAMSCVAVILKQRQLNKKQLETLLNNQLKSIISCLDEDDPSFRLITTEAFKDLISVSHQLFQEDQWKNICKEMLQRMNDSSDDVRIVAAQVFSIIFKNLPSKFPSDEFRATVKTLLVHLDDASIEIQKAVFACLKDAISFNVHNKNIILEELKEARELHRTTEFIDELMKLVQ